MAIVPPMKSRTLLGRKWTAGLEIMPKVPMTKAQLDAWAKRVGAVPSQHNKGGVLQSHTLGYLDLKNRRKYWFKTAHRLGLGKGEDTKYDHYTTIYYDEHSRDADPDAALRESKAIPPNIATFMASLTSRAVNTDKRDFRLLTKGQSAGWRGVKKGTEFVWHRPAGLDDMTLTFTGYTLMDNTAIKEYGLFTNPRGDVTFTGYSEVRHAIEGVKPKSGMWLTLKESLSEARDLAKLAARRNGISLNPGSVISGGDTHLTITGKYTSESGKLFYKAKSKSGAEGNIYHAKLADIIEALPRVKESIDESSDTVAALANFITTSPKMKAAYLAGVVRAIRLWKKKGKFDPSQAINLPKKLVVAGAKMFSKDWMTIYKPDVRVKVQRLVLSKASKDAAAGKVDATLPLKYQKGFKGYDESLDESTDSPAFKRWFGNSKVVDKQGNPLPVYHGTDSKFTVFNAGRSGMASGLSTGAIWFTDAHGSANDFGENVVDVYLSIKKPLVVDYRSQTGTRDSIQQMVSQARKGGHDGLIVKDIRDGAYTANVFAVFSPYQIKSATSNRGEYDPDSPDIGEGVTLTQRQLGSLRRYRQTPVNDGEGGYEGFHSGGYRVYLTHMPDLVEYPYLIAVEREDGDATSTDGQEADLPFGAAQLAKFDPSDFATQLKANIKRWLSKYHTRLLVSSTRAAYVPKYRRLLNTLGIRTSAVFDIYGQQAFYIE